MDFTLQPGSLYLALLLVSAAVCGFMGSIALLKRKRRGATTFGVLVALLLGWTLAEMATLLAGDPGVAGLARQVKFLFIPPLPVAVIVLALQYTDREQYLSPATIGLLSLVPAATVGFALTTASHGLLWSHGTLVPVAPYSVYEVTDGPWYWVHVAQSQLFLAFGSLLFVRWALSADAPYRRQAALILVGIAVPWAANLLQLSGVVSAPIDLTPVFFTASGACLGVAVFRFRFLDLVPIARDTAVAVTHDGMLVIDDNGRIVDANPAARALFPDDIEVVGEPLERVAPSALSAACYQSADDETVTLTVDGEERTFDLRRASIPGGGRVVALHDVTERRRQAEALERQNERLEQFAGVLSHDLRNPINVAQGYADLLAEEAEGQQRDYAERLVNALDRMDELVDDTLDLAHHGAELTDPEPIDLAAVAHEAWANVPTDGATLDVAVDATVMGDRARLVRLFENLFRNAVVHGGDDPSSITVSVVATDEGFAVDDDGRGIPESERATVLEPGYSPGDGGTGLGLTIVAEIVRAHGWVIEVGESEAGGARFAFGGVDDASGRETP